MNRFFPGLGALLLSVTLLHAQPEGVVSAVKHEGVMVTTFAQPDFFIFQCGNNEEHFDGSPETIEAQGGVTVGEPITGLHYMKPQPVVNGPAWSEGDRKLLEAQFHGAGMGNFYLFKTVEGLLFYLPKQGETPVIRIDYVLRGGQRVTVWTRK